MKNINIKKTIEEIKAVLQYTDIIYMDDYEWDDWEDDDGDIDEPVTAYICGKEYVQVNYKTDRKAMLLCACGVVDKACNAPMGVSYATETEIAHNLEHTAGLHVSSTIFHEVLHGVSDGTINRNDVSDVMLFFDIFAEKTETNNETANKEMEDKAMDKNNTTVKVTVNNNTINNIMEDENMNTLMITEKVTANKALVYGNVLTNGVKEQATKAVRTYFDSKATANVTDNTATATVNNATVTDNKSEKNNKEDNNMDKIIKTVTGKKVNLYRTTAEKLAGLAADGKVTAEDVAVYVGMYPKCNSSIDEVVKMWGTKATPYKALNGVGISKALLAAMDTVETPVAKENAAHAKAHVQKAPEAPQEAVVRPGKDNKAGTVKGQERADKDVTDPVKAGAQEMFNNKFVKNAKAANRTYNNIINNLLNNAVTCTRRVHRNSVDYVTVYMAEDAVCKATHGCWRNRYQMTPVNEAFMRLMLNKLVSNGVMSCVRNAAGKLIGFRIRAEVLARKYGTDLVYEMAGGMKFEVHQDKVVCVNTKAERTTTHELLHWLAQKATCVGALKAQAPVPVPVPAPQAAAGKAPSSIPEAKKEDNRPGMEDMAICDMAGILMNDRTGNNRLDRLMVKYVCLFPCHGRCDSKHRNGIIACLLDLSNRYGAKATPNSVAKDSAAVA